MSLKELAKEPVAWLSTAIGSVTGMLGLSWLDPSLFDLVISTSSFWFGGAAVFTQQIVPRTGLIPSGVADSLFLGAAAIYLVALAVKGFRAAKKYKKND